MTNLEFVGGNRSNKSLHLFGGPLVETDDAALDEGVTRGGDAPVGSESGEGQLEDGGGGSGSGCTDPVTCGEP
jgi:hypothetical protein